MKKILSLLLLSAVFGHATTNQLEFNYGRGSPRGSYRFGDIVRQEGPRGPQWSASWLHKRTHRTYLGLSGGHFRSGEEVSDTFVPNASSSRSLRMTSIMMLGRIDLSLNPKLTPYAIAGAGWVRNSLLVLSGSQIIADDAKSTLGYALGLGMDLALNDRLFIGAEAKYQSSVKRAFGTTPAGQAVTGLNEVAVPLGAFLFGAKVGVKY